MRYVNHAKSYIDALREWRASGMPDGWLSRLDELWSRLTPSEKTMAAKFIAWEVMSERDNSKDRSS